MLSDLTVVSDRPFAAFTAVSKSAQFTLHSGLECFVFYRDKSLEIVIMTKGQNATVGTVNKATRSAENY